MTDEIQIETVPKEQYLRLAADFENYKRSMEKQIGDIAKFGGQSVVLQMVDVLDLLEQAVAHAPPDTPPEWLKGLRQVSKKFGDQMEKFGVKRLETTGKTFDPILMEAVTVAAGGQSQQVKEEVRAGYMMHERVIRPARVIIYE